MQKRIAVIVILGTLVIGTSLFLGSCAKAKINSELQPTGQAVSTNSSVRLFNFYGYNLDVTINNIPLTAYGQSTANGTQAGLSLFPTGTWQTEDNGNPFFVPNSLVAKDREVHVQISTQPFFAGNGNGGITVALASIDTVLVDDPLNPKDYYATATGHLLVVPRNTQAPTQPQNFKIRVINLGAATDPNNLTGPVSLTYSDGTPVDPALSNVAAGSISPYIELPYAAVMFKVFSNNDFSRQLSELPTLPNFNSCAVPSVEVQESLFPKVRTFAPGATYSIVVTQNVGVFQACNPNSYPVTYQYNGYRIITEQSPGLNTTFARMDAFNALPVVPVSITVDGQPMASGPVPYATQAGYSIYVQGTHQVQVTDGEGNVLVTKSITLSPYDNYTAWVYQNASGQPDICFANTDMTSTIYNTDPNGNVATTQNGNPPIVPPTDDGTNGSLRVSSTPYAWQSRFLNLASDLSYATFTNNGSTFPNLNYGEPGPVTGFGDSTSFADASVNLSPGFTGTSNPFVIFIYQCTYGPQGEPGYGFVQEPNQKIPSSIRVFQSSVGPPEVVPGMLLGNIAALPATAYIVNPALYPNTAFMPQIEPGVYTTALIGRVFTSTSGVDAPRLVILKHNK